MGSDLIGKADGKPDFLVMAMRDAHSAPLQRVQVVKGWLDKNGKAQEKVFDVACSDGGKIDPKTQRCSDNGAKVDVKTCAFDQDKGDAELSAVWTDPEFDRETERLLLRPRAREPHLPLVDMGRDPLRRRAQPGARKDDPGTRLHLADLVHPDQGFEAVAEQASGVIAFLKRAVREPLVHFLAIGAALFVATA